jgi:hypothetical protein
LAAIRPRGRLRRTLDERGQYAEIKRGRGETNSCGGSGDKIRARRECSRELNEEKSRARRERWKRDREREEVEVREEGKTTRRRGGARSFSRRVHTGVIPCAIRGTPGKLVPRTEFFIGRGPHVVNGAPNFSLARTGICGDRAEFRSEAARILWAPEQDPSLAEPTRNRANGAGDPEKRGMLWARALLALSNESARSPRADRARLVG